ncbi:MAG TPA: CRISPR system precrRNA processing endoribonuclease RAMP protein Cas6 [Candidatus Hypogeohydataceae bacterium YC40]
MNNFQIARFRLTLKVLEEVNFPPYKGSVFRGGFGYAFKKVACTQKETTCNACLLKSTCVYSYVFETPPPKDSQMLRLYPRVPHPFIIEPPLEERQIYTQGAEIIFHLVLIGKAIDYLPYFVYAFIELGRMGIGLGRGRYELANVGRGLDIKGQFLLIYTNENKTILANPPVIKFTLDPVSSESFSEVQTLRFLTPARMRYKGSLTDELPFHVLMRTLLRRVSSLSYFHCGERIYWDFKSLIERAESVETLSSDLRWLDWERYSTRQGQKMKLGGVMGNITYRFSTKMLTGLLPLIKLGQHIHVGKGTSFGLGWYEVA